jgi:hypothetical protein
VAKADTQETRLEQLNKDKQTQQAESERLQAELASLVRSVSLDRELTR